MRRIRKRNSAADDRDAEEEPGVERQLLARHAAVQVINRILQHPRRQQLDRGGDDDAGEAEEEGALVPENVWQQPEEGRGHPVRAERKSDDWSNGDEK